MAEIEREYEYKPKWWALLLVAGWFALGAVVLGHKASGNDPDNLPVLYWVLCGLCVGFEALVAARMVERLFLRRRVAFTPASLLLPKALWTSEEVTIDYGSITGLFLSSGVDVPSACRVAIDCQATTGLPVARVRRARFLYVTHTGGECRIAVAELPSRAAFEEVCALLVERVGASRRLQALR
jgi:hypothetical protein